MRQDAVALNLQRQLQEKEREVANAQRELQRALQESPAAGSCPAFLRLSTGGSRLHP